MKLLGFFMLATVAGTNLHNLDPVHHLIESSGDVVLTGAFDPDTRETLVYAIPQARYNSLPSCSHADTLDGTELSPAAAVNAARKELVARYPEANVCSVKVESVSLIAWEISKSHGHVWVYLVDFKVDDAELAINGQRFLRFMVLLDGEPLPPRVTGYSQYIDLHRRDNIFGLGVSGLFKTHMQIVYVFFAGCATSGVLILLVLLHRRRKKTTCSI